MHVGRDGRQVNMCATGDGEDGEAESVEFRTTGAENDRLRGS